MLDHSQIHNSYNQELSSIIRFDYIDYYVKTAPVNNASFRLSFAKFYSDTFNNFLYYIQSKSIEARKDSDFCHFVLDAFFSLHNRFFPPVDKYNYDLDTKYLSLDTITTENIVCEDLCNTFIHSLKFADYLGINSINDANSKMNNGHSYFKPILDLISIIPASEQNHYIEKLSSFYKFQISLTSLVNTYEEKIKTSHLLLDLFEYPYNLSDSEEDLNYAKNIDDLFQKIVTYTAATIIDISTKKTLPQSKQSLYYASSNYLPYPINELSNAFFTLPLAQSSLHNELYIETINTICLNFAFSKTKLFLPPSMLQEYITIHKNSINIQFKEIFDYKVTKKYQTHFENTFFNYMNKLPVDLNIKIQNFNNPSYNINEYGFMNKETVHRYAIFINPESDIFQTPDILNIIYNKLNEYFLNIIHNSFTENSNTDENLFTHSFCENIEHTLLEYRLNTLTLNRKNIQNQTHDSIIQEHGTHQDLYKMRKKI